MFNEIISQIRILFQNPDGFIGLHEPIFVGREKEYVTKCIDSTFVSSVGEFVGQFENQLAQIVGAPHAVAVVNGTAALHMALMLVGVCRDDEVISPSLTFVATANAISYIGAHPVFLDVSRKNLGLCPEALDRFFKEKTVQNSAGECVNKKSGRIIRACVPMHTFGHAVEIDQIVEVCKRHQVRVVEDAAESLGSFYKGRHTGTFADVGIFSFNGNKVVTAGGGGALVTSDPELARRAKYLTTTAKRPHQWDFFHDVVGYNYRMPNLNAALACAQLEMLENFLLSKRKLADSYREFFESKRIHFVSDSTDEKSNYWLNALVLKDRLERDSFLEATNQAKVMTRPIWTPMHLLPMYENCGRDSLENTMWLFDRVVNIPSGVRQTDLETNPG